MSTHTTNAIVQTSKLVALGDAIRGKTGGSSELTLDEMATAITNFSGIVPTGTININSNGNVDVTNYATASVSVPGGVTNFAMGTFTGDAEGTLSINTGYQGSGYPIGIMISTTDGQAQSDIYSLSDWQGAGVACFFYKRYVNSVPGYSSNSPVGRNNYWGYIWYKGSAGNIANISSTGSSYSEGTRLCVSDAYTPSSLYPYFTSASQLKVHITNTKGTSGYKLGVSYRYMIVYFEP